MRLARVRRSVAAVVALTLVLTGTAVSAESTDVEPASVFPSNVPGLNVSTTSTNLGSIHVGLPEVAASLGLPAHFANMHSVGRVFLTHQQGSPPVTITDLSVTGAGFSGNYAGPSLPHTLPDGSQISIKVGYRPGGAGSSSGSLVVETNLGSVTVPLSGRGVGGNVLYRLNAGGSVVGGDAAVPSFIEDRLDNSSSYFALNSGGTVTPTLPSTVVLGSSVPGNVPVGMFSTLRRSVNQDGGFAYRFPTIDPGSHMVRLYFADSFPSADRWFDVFVNGNQNLLRNFSITNAAGGPNRGVARAFVIDADDVIDISFRDKPGATIEDIGAKVSGIEVATVSSVSAQVAGSDFGVVPIGGDIPKQLVIRNNGGPTSPAFRVDGIGITGPGAPNVTHASVPQTWLAPGDELAVNLVLSPTQVGDQSVTLTASIWGGFSAQKTIAATAVTTAGTLQVDPSASFGAVRVGSTETRALTLTNPSSSVVHVPGADLSGSPAFAFDKSAFPFTIAAGSSVTLDVSYSPTSLGVDSGRLRIEHTGTNRPSVVDLNGTGQPRFNDIAGSVFGDDILWLAETGITRGCNPPVNDRFCPEDNVTRGQMAAFFVRALGLVSTGESFDDTVGHLFEADIARLAAADVTRGCNPPNNTRFCPDDNVTRGQMAAFFVRALGLAVSGGGFTDTAGHIFDGDIRRLAGADITRGCNPPQNTRFCPDDFVTRAQMAAFFHRAADLLGLPR